MKDKIDKVKLFHEVFLIGNEDTLKTDVEKSTFQFYPS